MILGMTDAQAIILSEVLAFLIGPFAIAFLQRRLMMPWLRVKLSRGSKVLVRQITRVHDYFTVGTPKGKFVSFKDYTGKKVENIPFDDENIYDAIGVKCIDFDVINSTALNRKQMSMVNGFNREAYDELVTMAQLREGSELELYFKIALAILAVVAIVVLIGVYFDYKAYDAVHALGTVAGQAVQGGI